MGPTRWALLVVARGGAPVWSCGGVPASRRRASEGVLRVTDENLVFESIHISLFKYNTLKDREGKTRNGKTLLIYITPIFIDHHP